MVRRFWGTDQMMTDQTPRPDVLLALCAPRAELRRPELDRSATSGAGVAQVGGVQT